NVLLQILKLCAHAGVLNVDVMPKASRIVVKKKSLVFINLPTLLLARRYALQYCKVKTDQN
ncbi:MAG: hypothetical protein ACREQE_01275, partial [Candidatus Binataceae bacterium]